MISTITLNINMVRTGPDEVTILPQTMDGEDGDLLLNGQPSLSFKTGDVLCFTLCENGKMKLLEHEPKGKRQALVRQNPGDITGMVVDIVYRDIPSGQMFAVASDNAVVGDKWCGDRLWDGAGKEPRDKRWVLVRERDGEVVSVSSEPLVKKGHKAKESNEACVGMHTWDGKKFVIKAAYDLKPTSSAD
ncbi:MULTISPECIES: hypothetical protein [Aurantimonas]|uniref:hypothetical protein n=1 Tax=Aurantimonas TaxID=182269 RepID=UPI003511D6BC|nr:hypothetical protein [Aurantimonas litoralis]